MAKYELWEKSGDMSFIDENHPQKKLLIRGMKKIWEVEAQSFDEACFQRNKHLGWEPYRPMCPYCINDMAYGEECCDECKAGDNE